MHFRQFSMWAHFVKNYWKQSHLHDSVITSDILDPNLGSGRMMKTIKVNFQPRTGTFPKTVSGIIREKGWEFELVSFTSYQRFCVCCTFIWEPNNFKDNFSIWAEEKFQAVHWYSSTEDSFSFILLITVKRVTRNDLEKRKTNPEREETRKKRGRSEDEEDREKALVML